MPTLPTRCVRSCQRDADVMMYNHHDSKKRPGCSPAWSDAEDTAGERRSGGIDDVSSAVAERSA